MTKRQKKECSSPGCHNKALIDITVLERPEEARYYCNRHYVSYIGYMARFYFTQTGEQKEDFLYGIELGV